ncbi:MAG: PH domain-containing protein [Chloroflexi bacterium]|nr:PH domain-containing protein [Chloroflexota bacterium]
MDLVERLRRIPLFQNVSDDYLPLIADIAEQHVAGQGALLTRQAELGATFFIIDEGECLVRRVDERGMQRPVGMIVAGEGFGESSLFLGERRDATVIALTPVRYWTIHRSDFEALLAEHPALIRQLNISPAVRERLRAPRYPWLEPGESVIYHSSRHWVVFVRSMSLSTLVVLAYLGLLILLAHRAPEPLPWLRLLLPLLPVYGGAFLWHWVDWRNDYFVVSTRRIIYRERVAFLYESRREAPLDRVQNIHVERGFWGQILNYGDLTIQTAADVGAIRFDHVPAPEEMREAIWSELSRAQAMRRAAERHLIREALISHLDLSDDAPPSEVSPGEEAPIDLIDGPEMPKTKPGTLSRFVLWLMRHELIPPTRIVREDSVTWRKHWIFLLAEVVPPVLLILSAGTLALLGFFGIPEALVRSIPYYPAILLFLTIIGLGWLWWQFNDWGNDLYIVTDERIIDIEKRPLFFSEQRREASLGMIQNVNLEIPNMLATALDYGNVLVQTAGAGDFTFDGVPNPRGVQNEIFQRIEVFREAQRQREAARRRAELAEWFSVYNELTQREKRHPPADLPERDEEQNHPAPC